MEGWAVTPLHVFVKRWNALPNYLNSVYPRNELDSFFFTEKFKQLIGSQVIEDISETDKREIELLLHDVLAQWDALLHAKILDFQLDKFGKEEESYLDFMSKKIQEYTKLKNFLNPFFTNLLI